MPAQAKVEQLQHIAQEVRDALRAQRKVLRQRDIGLPPGTLNELKEAQNELKILASGLADSAQELEHLRALAETTTLVNSSLDVNRVLNEVMDTVIALTGAERGYIVLRNKYTGQMEYRIARSLDRETIDQDDFIISRTIVEQVAQTGTEVLTTDALSDPDYQAQESIVIHGLRSILCVPLIVKGTVTGVVYVDNRVKNALFGHEQQSLLMDFTNQAAIAVENARLFEQVQTALAEITAMKELMDNVFASIASGVITTNVQGVVTTYNLAAGRILATPHHDVLGMSLASTIPVIYEHISDLLAVVYRHSTQKMVEIEPVLPIRGVINLNLKLTPLKNQDLTEGVAIVVDDLTEIKKRDATLDVVRHYLPPAMVDNIQSLDELGLGGERRIITSIFVESRPFHAFPAALRPHELMELLNLYLTVGSEAIHNQTGVVDKFMGNEIMGLFNTQLNPSDDHAWCAIQAALNIVDDYAELTHHLEEDSASYYRIGIHTGVATLGNVGSRTRREFTAIGDTVNLTKRLQENARPGQVIISDETYRHCAAQLADTSNQIQIRERSNIQVKGRRQTVTIYEVRRRPTAIKGND